MKNRENENNSLVVLIEWNSKAYLSDSKISGHFTTWLEWNNEICWAQMQFPRIWVSFYHLQVLDKYAGWFPGIFVSGHYE